MAAKAILVLPGDPPPRDVLDERPALVVAVDGGGATLDAWGVVPDVVIGDMDSIDPGLLARFESAGARVIRHPRAKLHTDARLALDLALSEGAREIVLAGSTGGRLDQTAANLGLLLRAVEAGARVRAYESSGRLWSVAPGAELSVPFPKGAIVSLLALSPIVEGIRLTGVRWSLDGARMEFGDPYGVSNEAQGGPVDVAVTRGVAVLIAPR